MKKNTIYRITTTIKKNEDGEKAKTFGIASGNDKTKTLYNDLSTDYGTVKSFVDLLNRLQTNEENIYTIIYDVFSN